MRRSGSGGVVDLGAMAGEKGDPGQGDRETDDLVLETTKRTTPAKETLRRSGTMKSCELTTFLMPPNQMGS